MAERKITTKIELTGEAQYKQALSSLSSSLKLYNSELSILKTKYKDAQNIGVLLHNLESSANLDFEKDVIALIEQFDYCVSSDEPCTTRN